MASEVKKGEDTVFGILADFAMETVTGRGLKDVLNLYLKDMVVVPEKEYVSLKHSKEGLERIKTLMGTRLNELKENLKLYSPAEPIYSKICGEIEAYEQLRKELE